MTVSHSPPPSTLWLEAVTCSDPEWLKLGRALPLCADRATLVALWQSWPGHKRHSLSPRSEEI